MKKTWQEHDLEGQGLQSINLAFATKRKTVKTAYLLATLFPLGLHQFYLGNYRRASIYIMLTVLLFALVNYLPFLSALLAFSEVVLLTKDIISMETAVANFNKQLKMQLALQEQQGAPKDFKGRYSDEGQSAENEKNSSDRILSFAEQERLLKEMNLKKSQDKK